MDFQKTKGEYLEMHGMTHDLAILGSGFGGSLCALIAKQLGLEVILLDNQSHPRFAIGESSTPQADLMLRHIADTYNLEFLRPFASYGSWVKEYPDIPCGPKRGFSYFNHQVGGGELLVAANPDLEHADTHWYRESFDAFLAGKVKKSGIELIENTQIQLETTDCHTLRLNGREIQANFVIDATGGSNPLSIEKSNGFHTRSRSIYAHFTGVAKWGEMHQDNHHPFKSHNAALHHLIDGGWMYVLHFDNGITSAGFVLDMEHHPLTDETPDEEWIRLIKNYSKIATQFEQSKQVTPLIQTAQLQHKSARCAGENWAMLPNSAYFIDPLHSTGNAHTLYCIERLMKALKSGDSLTSYESLMFDEASLIDDLVSGAYGVMSDFDSFANIAMLYFAGADFSERKRRAEGQASFINSQDESYRETVSYWTEQARLGYRIPNLKDAIEPWNCVGLCDESKQNMYDYA